MKEDCSLDKRVGGVDGNNYIEMVLGSFWFWRMNIVFIVGIILRMVGIFININC